MAKYVYVGRYSSGFFSGPSYPAYTIVSERDGYTYVYEGRYSSGGFFSSPSYPAYTIVSEYDSGTYVYEGAYSSGGFFSSLSKPVYKIVSRYDDHTYVYKVDNRGREKELLYTIVSTNEG